MTCGLLLESGDLLLLESGDQILAEGCVEVATPTGGVRYGPAPRRPVKVRRRRRYLAGKSCRYRIVYTARHHAPPIRAGHTAGTRLTARHHTPTRTEHRESMYGAATVHRTVSQPEVRCDLYRPPSPREVGERLARLYAELS